MEVELAHSADHLPVVSATCVSRDPDEHPVDA